MKSFGSRSSLWGLRFALGLAAACVLGLSSVAQAADGPSSRKAAAPSGKKVQLAKVRIISVPLPEECPADDNEPMSGMRAFVDPKTGELRPPTPEEGAALSRAIAGEGRFRAQAVKEAQVGVNGGVNYYLGDEGMVDVIAHIGSDGKAVFACSNRAETPKVLARPPAPKKNDAAKEEK